MEVKTIGDARVPALGLGTWRLAGEACRRSVAEALSLGYRHVDTAQMYRNESEVGRAIAGSGVAREQIWVTTKVDNPNHAADRVHASVAASLRQLGTDYVDLLLIHWPVAFERLGETLEAMARLQFQGKVRFLGVSNFSSTQYAAACELAPVVNNQVEYHPFLSQKVVLDAIRARGGTVTAYSPLAHGRVAGDPTLTEVAERHNTTAAAVALRWLLDQDAVLAIPKASNPAHLRGNLEAEALTLDDQERHRINGLARQERLIDPAGYGQRWD